MQKAITSLNQDDKHPFWGKFKEALWTLVKVPKSDSSVVIKCPWGILAESTYDSIARMDVDIPVELRRKFPLNQPKMDKGTTCKRLRYDSGDLEIIGNISRFFPGRADKFFDLKDGRITICSLSFIHNLIVMCDVPDSIICDQNSENIFVVNGRNGPIMVSVWEKLDNWHMREVTPGSRFRGSHVYVFA